MVKKYIGVRVTDTKSKNNTGVNDRYSLIVRPGMNPTVFRTFDKQTRNSSAVMRGEEIKQMQDVPARVADVFNQYIDATALGMSSTGNSQTLETEEATITINDNGVEYKYAVYRREYVDVIKSGTGSVANIPVEIENEAKQHIPQGAKYLGGGSVHP